MTDEVLKGFKAVATHEGDYRSVMNYHIESIVIYIPNQWVEPQQDCGPLAVFTKEDWAISFLKGMYNTWNDIAKIFECEYIPSTRQYIRCRGTLRSRHITNLPPATALAEAVRILP